MQDSKGCDGKWTLKRGKIFQKCHNTDSLPSIYCHTPTHTYMYMYMYTHIPCAQPLESCTCTCIYIHSLCSCTCVYASALCYIITYTACIYIQCTCIHTYTYILYVYACSTCVSVIDVLFHTCISITLMQVKYCIVEKFCKWQAAKFFSVKCYIYFRQFRNSFQPQNFPAILYMVLEIQYYTLTEVKY